MRTTLHQEEVKERSVRIIELFRSLKLDGIQVLLSYAAIPERNEFDVRPCEQLHLLNHPSARIAWPRLDKERPDMEAIELTDTTIFAKNLYGIDEPQGGNIIDPQLIDAVFVPLLAFDVKGYRVGYGKGFYDRYLVRCAPDIVKIGFSFFEALPVIDDIGQFDVPLNLCITPARIYEF